MSNKDTHKDHSSKDHSSKDHSNYSQSHNQLPGPGFSYNLIIETPILSEGGVIIDLGNHKGWIKQYKEELKHATRIGLIPKKNGPDYNSNMPIISVNLDNNKRWIFFTKVFGKIIGGQGKAIRVYCIGWQRTIDGENYQSKLWIYPNGTVEHSDEPSHAHNFIN